MKTRILNSISALIILLLVWTPLTAQDGSAPAYLTVTTLFWNMDREDSDNEGYNDWLEVEKEYLEKVTKKNEYLMSVSFFMHLYSATSNESKYVQVYGSWADIEKAQNRNAELEKEAWPDEAKRTAFLENRQSFYQDYHTDEILVPFPAAKGLTEAPTEDMVTYVRTSKMAYPSDGSQEEFTDLHKTFIQLTVLDNDKIKAYYPNMHGWGSDRRDFIEAFYLDSTDDLNDLTEGNSDAFKAKWPELEDRQAFFKKYNRYFTGEHGDAIYTRIAELSK